MRGNISWLSGVQWLFLLCCALFCYGTAEQNSAQKHRNKCWYGYLTQNLQKQHRPKKYCDPLFSNQTAGAITQRCASGFYREWTGPHRGQCVPCRCNGLSNECDGHTGKCVNCQFNTAGDRCERCKEGYYGDAAQGTCRTCPCPLTWNNFALACLDVSPGVVECLCKWGYHGARCERCASGYYGNPMMYGGSCQPCNCNDGTSNICDSLTGKCITSGDNGCGDHCHECDSCNYALLDDLERMDDELAWLKQHLQNISQGAVSLTMLNRLEASISETKILVGRYSTAVNGLDSKFEQLESDVDIIREDLSQIIDKTQITLSSSEKVLEDVDGTNVNAGDLVSEAQAVLTAVLNLVKQLIDMKADDSTGVPEEEVARMLEEAQRVVQEMRRGGCTAQRENAAREQEEAHKLLELIWNNLTVPVDTNQAFANRTAIPIMTSGSSLTELAEALSDAEATVDRTRGLNLNSHKTLKDVLNHTAQVEREHEMILPTIEMTKDQLWNITDLFGMLQESKNELDHLVAQLDDAKLTLAEKLNRIFQAMDKVDIVIKAEEHAEELDRLAREIQLAVHNATSTTLDLLNAVIGKGTPNSIINAIEEAEMAANQSKEAADLAFRDVEQGGLINNANGLKNNASHLLTEATETQNYLKIISDRIGLQKDRVNQRKEKGELLSQDILAVNDDLEKIKRDDIGVLLDSAKTAASASNDTAHDVTDRLRNILLEMGKISLPNASADIDGLLRDADKALGSFNTALPTLNDTLAQIQDLGSEAPPSGNMTESIRRIKDVIEETRTFVNRLSIATTFNGKGYIELRPPSNLEDVKAFTAVDLLLNRHQTTDRRRRRQDKQKDANHFVFYLGNNDSSSDYVGMAIRKNILVCVYKLGEEVYEIETSPIITTSNVNSTVFDRVVFHRVYQDAEVNVTLNFTSADPLSLPPKQSLPNTTIGVLNLDPKNVVFYVGGYPNDFTPPVELDYPKFRGAMKLSSVNDKDICLFNYKHAINMGDKQPYVKVPQAALSDYYEGTGYRMALISNPDKKKRRFFKFRTKSLETNALLFYLGNKDSYVCVFVDRGHLVLQGRQADQELKVQSSEKVSLFNKQLQFAIDVDEKFTVYCGPQSISIDHNETSFRSFYIGGLPIQLRERHNITAPPLRGCVDHLTVNNDYVEYNRTIGVSVGCPISLLGVHGATFNAGGSLSVDSPGLWDEPQGTVSLGFRSTEKHGALLRFKDSTSVCDFQLALVHGHVVLNCDNKDLKSHKKYNDGSWHYLSVVKTALGLELRADDENVGQIQSCNMKCRTLELGGETFNGCIANLYTRRPVMSFIPADLSSFSQKGDVVLGRCSLNHPAQAMPLPAALLQKPQRHKNVRTQTGAIISYCRGSPTHNGEYRLSEPDSWLSYNLPLEDLNYRPHFSLEVKTRSSRGLLFHVAGRGDISLVALFMANGKIKLSLGHNRVIQHQEKSNDGNWHRVVFSVEKNTFHLLVDGFRVNDGYLSDNGGSSLDLQNPVHFGSDPTHKASQSHLIPKKSVIGCIRDFKLSEILIGSPVASHGVLSCSNGLPETGTYFEGNGGHIVLDKYFTVGSHFELAFELRPRSLTGLLFHVRSQQTSLNVFLEENKVGVEVNDGNNALNVSVTPHQNMCDGQFHVVTVSKQHEVIKLEVDFVSEQEVGRKYTSYSTSLDSLYIGGIPGTTRRNRVPSFVGCLRNVKVNGKPVAFEAASRVVGPVNINKCPAA